MATQTLVAPADYLKMSFEGIDREYHEGTLIERNMPTYLHARIQIILGYLFETLRQRYPVFAASELRLAVNTHHVYRIPDVCVFVGTEPPQPVPDAPPLVAIEIMSPDERMSETLEKFEEYRIFGIENIWLIDPEKKKFYTYDASGLHPVRSLDLPQYEFVLTFAALGLE